MNNKTLILNLDGSPLGVINIRRAIRLLLVCQDIVPLKFYDDEIIHGDGKKMQVPAVILYREYIHFDIKKCPSKKLVLKRDNFICQYCSKRMDDKEATVDHVVPVQMFKSKRDANTWLNMVACCLKCNGKKANKPLESCGLKLQRKPRYPRREDIFNYKDAPKEWSEFLKGA